MGDWFVFRLRRIAQQAVDADICAGELRIENSQKVPESAEPCHAKNIDFEPERILQFVPRAAPFDVHPGEPVNALRTGRSTLSALLRMSELDMC